MNFIAQFDPRFVGKCICICIFRLQLFEFQLVAGWHLFQPAAARQTLSCSPAVTSSDSTHRSSNFIEEALYYFHYSDRVHFGIAVLPKRLQSFLNG